MATYIALLRKTRKSDYGIDFPDFPGCVTAGKSLDEARRLAVELLRFHVEGMIEDGEAIPSPSRFDAIMAERHDRDAVAFLVDVPDIASPCVRVNITLPEAELERIDDRVRESGTTRSAFLLAAARERLVEATGPTSPPRRRARRRSE